MVKYNAGILYFANRVQLNNYLMIATTNNYVLMIQICKLNKANC